VSIFGRKVPHLRFDHIQGQKVKGQGPINADADTDRAPYLPNGKAYTNFKLGILFQVLYLTVIR